MSECVGGLFKDDRDLQEKEINLRPSTVRHIWSIIRLMRLLRLSFLYWGRYKRFPHLLLYYMRTTVGGGDKFFQVITMSAERQCREPRFGFSLPAPFFLRQNARQPISDISPDGGS